MVKALNSLSDTVSAVAAAKNELSDAKDRASRGELSQSAVKDYEINLAAATLNLANAQINLGSTAAGAANTAATAGFSATAKAEHTQTTSIDTQSKGEWQGTELNGANATFVGDDFTGTGLKGNIGKLNIDNLGSFTLNAGTNTSSGSSTSKTSSQTGSISTTGSASLGISQQQSSAQSQGNTYTNSELNVGEFNGYADTTNLTGGRINAGGGSYGTDTLNIETVQNSASSSDKSSGGNIGINFAGGAPSGGSIGANKANGNSQSLIAAEQSGIVYSSDNHRLTANNTTNIGGILANINTDKDGNQTNGALNFTTGSLTTKDLINTATEEQRSIGGSLSTGKTATGVSLNNVGIQLGNTGRDFESVTRATIGQGAIVTGDTLTGKDSLAGVNRDALNTETVTKDMQTGGLAVDTGIDTRVFTKAGRDEIAKEQKELGKNVNTTSKITAAAGIQGAATAGNIITGNQNISQTIQGAKTPSQMAKVIQDHPEVGAVLQSYQQGDYDGLLNSQNALQILSDSTGVSVDVIITSLTNQLRARGTTDGQLVAIDSDVNNRKDTIKTTAHELDHVRGGSSEYLADLAGIAADLNVSASMDANQDKIDSYKPALGDGKDSATQLENEQLLGQNDETLGDKLAESPDEFDYKTSTIQDVKYALTYFSPGARQAYEKIDASQEQAFLRGQKKAVDEFVQNTVNAPDDIKALYQAAKENPAAVTAEIIKSLGDIPEEYIKKFTAIASASFVGNSDDDFYNSGKASTELGLEAVTAIVSAGGAVVVKKTAGKVTGIEFKFPRKKPNRSDTNGTHDTGTGKNVNNKTNSQNTNTIGNDNYFDSFGNNAPYTRDYSAELQADIDKQKAKNDKFDAEMKAADAKREAEWTKIQAETDALLASSNELLKEVEVDRRINDRVAEADRIMDDFNHSKANENLSIEDSISISQIPQSNQNARQIINPDSPEAWDGGSERIYNSIRANNEDVLKISQNTGLPESQIQRIKNHVFFKDHELNNGSTGRYDADPDIANAWNRLEQGDYTQIDIDLLNHEIRESLVEGIFKVPAQKAHEATVNKGFDWNPSN